MVGNTSYNKLDPKEQARLWHTFDYVCWKACRKSGTECSGRAEWRDRKPRKVEDFQRRNLDKFLSMDYVVAFVVGEKGRDGRYVMDRRDQSGTSKLPQTAYFTVDEVKYVRQTAEGRRYGLKWHGYDDVTSVASGNFTEGDLKTKARDEFLALPENAGSTRRYSIHAHQQDSAYPEVFVSDPRDTDVEED